MDYELLDSGSGRRLERFGKYILDRPDPEVMWSPNLTIEDWSKADAKFENGWKTNANFPKKWLFNVNELTVGLKLTPFKHVGIFPEQKFEWDLIQESIEKSNRPVNVLSLFGYTGVASLAALSKGADVTHVDASKPAITWFKDNQKQSNLDDKKARIFIDDAIKFTAREIKRGVKYDGVVMDPPVYGHGPNGEKWQFSKNFPELLDNVSKILSNNPLFVIVNAYAVSTSPTSIGNMLQDKLKKFNGSVTSGELTLIEKSGNRTLSTGIWSIWKSHLI